MTPTRRQLLAAGRQIRRAGYEAISSVKNRDVGAFLAFICEQHNTECTHSNDAFSLALDGEDLEELL